MTNETLTITKFNRNEKGEQDFQLTSFKDSNNWSIEVFRCFETTDFGVNGKGFICESNDDAKHIVWIHEDLQGKLTLTLDNQNVKF